MSFLGGKEGLNDLYDYTPVWSESEIKKLLLGGVNL